MKRKGISLVSVTVVIVIMFVLISVISVSLTYSITNAKKMAFAKEIYNVQNLVTEYIEREESLPMISDAVTVVPTDRTQFVGETFNDSELTVYVLNLQGLGIKNTSYGNKEIGDSPSEREKDVYAVSESTGKVYYIAGFEAGGKKYYTLTDELKQMIEKKQGFTIGEKTVTFTPSKIGWSAEGVSVTVFVPSEFSSPSISIDNANITYTFVSNSQGLYYNVNTSKVAEAYTITITYTNNGSSATATYSARIDNDYPTITKDENISNTSDYVKGLSANDITSSIKYFKYAEGVIGAENVAEYMHAYGKDISGGNMKFDVRKDAYTIYAEDKAGNYTAMYIDVYGNLVANNPATFYVPSGFVVSSLEGETEVSEGLVIYEGTETVTSADLNENGIIDDQEDRNQYVWVPVPEITEFVRRDGYFETNLQAFVSNGDVTEPFNKGSLSKTNDLTGEYAEYEKMYDSVRKYGGFYIARYEAGSETQRTNSTDTELEPSKKNKYIYNYVAWGTNMTNVSSGAVKLSRDVYKENSNSDVVSTLIYGVEWDAAIKFLSDAENTSITPSKPYIQNSANMGWYNNNYSSGNSLHRTGIDIGENKTNKVKNIYDMAGNILDWSMEAYSNNKRVYRGGYYLNTNNSNPASNRGYGSPDGAYEYTGFRIALYIK